MKIFLDTAHIDEIRQALDLGLLDGVTTNPTHVSKTGREPMGLYREICQIVPGPVSLETISEDREGIIEEAKELTDFGANVVVKVPLTREGLAAVAQLSQDGIHTNVTLNFSAPQALLAAKAGATYISPFVGRLDAAGEDGLQLLSQIRRIYDNYGFKTQILAAACRHTLHVLRAAEIGCDACTMALPILLDLYEHPQTREGLEMFLRDWKKVPTEQKQTVAAS
jgi:transaldolase